MGVGIGAVVPLKFLIKCWDLDNEKSRNYEIARCFHKEFFNFFDREKISDNYVFTIKDGFLLANYRDFLQEFYQLIGEDLFECTNIYSEDDILKLKDMDSFAAAFDDDARGGGLPDICDSRGMVSVLGCECSESWLFFR